MKPVETPIAFIIFNRPDTTQKVFEEIRKAKPKKLFVISDGPRNNEEKKLVEKTRAIIDQVDWDCEVKKNYSEKNLGCKMRVLSGISWFFKQVEYGIILEDDCVPTQSFFPFCEELLEKYKDNKKIMMISGDNFQDGKQRGSGSYYFSRYCHLWGWATWKRAWELCDREMYTYPKFRNGNGMAKIWNDLRIAKHWIHLFDKAYVNKIDTWDYHWLFSIWSRGSVAIIPNTNLVTNIGFDSRATHTKKEDQKISNLPRREMVFPLIHPSTIEINEEADAFSNKRLITLSEQNKIKAYLIGHILIPSFSIYKKFKKIISA